MVNFDMKFNMIKHRDNAVYHFVKRVLSCYGILVLYSFQGYVDPVVYEMMQDKVYINHINALDKYPDAECGVSLVEAILNYINRIFPHITKVIPQNEIRYFIKIPLCRSAFKQSAI